MIKQKFKEGDWVIVKHVVFDSMDKKSERERMLCTQGKKGVVQLINIHGDMVSVLLEGAEMPINYHQFELDFYYKST